MGELEGEWCEFCDWEEVQHVITFEMEDSEHYAHECCFREADLEYDPTEGIWIE